LVWSHSSGEPASFCALGLMPWQRLNIGSKPALRPPANPGEKTDPDPPFGMVRPHAPHQVAYAITWARENYYLTHRRAYLLRIKTGGETRFMAVQLMTAKHN